MNARARWQTTPSYSKYTVLRIERASYYVHARENCGDGVILIGSHFMRNDHPWWWQKSQSLQTGSRYFCAREIGSLPQARSPLISLGEPVHGKLHCELNFGRGAAVQ